MPNKILIADIGGTNARFALYRDQQIVDGSITVLACNDFDNLDAAVKHYLSSQQTTVDHACMAFACPVASGEINMTNNHWAFNSREMQQRLNLTTFKVINDFTAQALALPELPEASLLKIGGGEPLESAAKLIIGPGTGLGVAGLKPVAEHWLPLPGEGGHAAVSPTCEQDFAVLEKLQQQLGYVSWESVLCGSGLEQLYRVHSELAGINDERKDVEITTGALNDEPLCKQVLMHFFSLLGRAASNAALTLGAQGGVYIAGGIIPRVKELFAESDFRREFERNDKMSGYVANIPTYLITHDNPGLLGAGAAMDNPFIQ